MSNNNQNATEKYNFCSTKVKTTTEKFIWTIDNFSELPEKCGECLDSTEYISTAPNGQLLKWQIKMYPNGFEEEFKDYVAAFLHLIDSNNEEVNAKFQFSIRKSNGQEFERLEMPKECTEFSTSDTNACGSNVLIKRELLLNARNGYLNGDSLTIVCILIVHQRSVEKAPLPDVEVPKCRALEDLAYLFENSLFPDCKITSEDNKVFKAHKCILACRSPVFAAMFQHEMIERNSNEVEIVDIKGDVIEKMLRYIYSGKEPDYENPKMAANLLKAADKYELIRLKLLCERKLINSLGNVNVCALLILANAYLAQNLKTHAINYVKMNLNEVKKTQGWKLLLADEQLMDEIMTAMAN